MEDKYEPRRIYGKYFCCKRMKLYAWLCERGFKVAFTAPDMHNSDYVVWYFPNDKEGKLEYAVNAYYREAFSKNNG